MKTLKLKTIDGHKVKLDLDRIIFPVNVVVNTEGVFTLNLTTSNGSSFELLLSEKQYRKFVKGSFDA